MRALRPIVVILLLGLVVAPAWASAQGLRSESRSALLDRLGSFLTSLWSAAGCAIAPWEHCLDGSAAPDGDAGPVIDPWGVAGRYQAVPAGDEGPVIDPAGLRSDVELVPAGDEGPVIDPWGVAGR